MALGEKAQQSMSGQQTVGTIGKAGMTMGMGGLMDTGNPYANSGVTSAAQATFSGMQQGQDAETIASDAAKAGALGAGKSLVSDMLTQSLHEFGGLVSNVVFDGVGSALAGDDAKTTGAKLTGSGVMGTVGLLASGLAGGPGALFAGALAGPVVRDTVQNGLIGDAFDSRTNESFRDSLEGMNGYIDGKTHYETISQLESPSASLAYSEQAINGTYTLDDSLGTRAMRAMGITTGISSNNPHATNASISGGYGGYDIDAPNGLNQAGRVNGTLVGNVADAIGPSYSGFGVNNDGGSGSSGDGSTGESHGDPESNGF